MNNDTTIRIIIAVLAALVAQQASATECARFADFLDTCTPHMCEFKHPITGQNMQRTILGPQVGPKGATCAYTEQMPNNGTMNCHFDSKTRQDTAAYHRSLAGANTYGATNTSSPDGRSTTSHHVDGKPVTNPMQHALSSGQCKVEGYGRKPAPKTPVAEPASPAVAPVTSSETSPTHENSEPAKPNPVVKKVEEKGKRQVDRQSSRTEREIDREIDRRVDKVFDRLWK